MPTNPLAYLPPPILTLLVYSMLYRLSFCLRNEQKLFWERLLKALGTMITMDENTSELFQQLAKQVLELPLDEEN